MYVCRGRGVVEQRVLDVPHGEPGVGMLGPRAQVGPRAARGR